MKIDIQACLESRGKPLALEHTYELSYLMDRNPQLLLLSSVILKAHGMLQSGLFVVRGQLSGSYTVSCSRCLTELPTAFEHPFEEFFSIQGYSNSQTDVDVDQDQDGENEIHPIEGKFIDLLPYIEEEVLLAIPYIPVCPTEEECKVNLPQEGQDWRILTDEEKKDKIDPRLADLAKFFNQNNKQ